MPGGSFAAISDGIIAQNASHGIHVSIGRIQEPATARIGLDGDAGIEISDNGEAGILVDDDGFSAEIDSCRIVFRENAEGDMVGNVVDVATGP